MHLNEATDLPRLAGTIVFLVIFIPTLISALDALEIHGVGTVDEALAVALEGASLSEGSVRFPSAPLPQSMLESRLHLGG